MFIQYHNENEPKVSIIYQPAFDLLCSLHVIGKPNHHLQRLTFAENVYSRMSDSHRELFNFYYEGSNGFLELLSLLDSEKRWNMSVLEIIDELKSMNIFEFYNFLLYESLTKEQVSEELFHPQLSDLNNEMIEMFKHPKKYQESFCDFLLWYYKTHYMQIAQSMEALCIKQMNHQYEVAKNMDIYEYIHNLHPRIENTSKKINFHKYKLFEIYKKDLNEVLINVTSFIMPHLLFGEGLGYLVLVTPIYIQAINNNDVPKDTRLVFKALGDETRLKIVKILYDGPRSTQSLADQLCLTEAAISKQLRLLHQSGIVIKERDGSFMNYHLNQAIIDSLVLLMYEFLG